jgi:hypothetical protein
VLRRRVRPGRAIGDRPGDRDDVDHVRPSCGFERRQEGPQAPDRAEVVDAQHFLEPVEVDLGEAAPSGDAGVVHQQLEPGVALAHLRGHALDVLAPADVAQLVLRTQLVGKRMEAVLTPCEQHELPAARGERARDCRTDPARGPGDDADARQWQTRRLRVAENVRPPASVATAVST